MFLRKKCILLKNIPSKLFIDFISCTKEDILHMEDNVISANIKPVKPQSFGKSS